MKNMMSDRVQFLSILNTAHRSSVACAAFPDFFLGILKECRKRDRNTEGFKQSSKQSNKHTATADGWNACLIHFWLVVCNYGC